MLKNKKTNLKRHSVSGKSMKMSALRKQGCSGVVSHENWHGHYKKKLFISPARQKLSQWMHYEKCSCTC